MSLPHIFRLVPLLLPLALAACANSPLKHSEPGAEAQSHLNDAQAKLAKADLCCTNFSQFKFDAPLPSEPKKFTIGPGLPVADFGGSRSWFLAFHLPQGQTPYRVVFKSTLTGRWLHHSYLFAPSIAILDSLYQPMRTEDVELCEYMGWTQTTSGAFGHITIKNPDARYLVVYSSGNQLSGSTYWEQSPTAFSAQEPVQMASSGSFQIPHGPNGTVFVGKLTHAYAKSVNHAICNKPSDQPTGIFGHHSHTASASTATESAS